MIIRPNKPEIISRRSLLLAAPALILAKPTLAQVGQIVWPPITNPAAGGGGTNPFALVAHTSQTGNGPGLFVSPAVNTVGADLIVWGFSYYGQASAPYTSSVYSDSQSNTWTLLAAYDAGLGTVCASVQMIYCYAPTTNASHTFQVNGLSFTSFFIAAFSGSAASPLDQHNGNGTTGDPVSLQPNSVTPTVDNELLVSIVSAAGNTMGVDSSFVTTDLVNDSGGSWLDGGLAYFKQTTAGALNPTWSWTHSGGGGLGAAAMIASFK